MARFSFSFFTLFRLSLSFIRREFPFKPFRSFRHRHRLTASNLKTLFSGMLKISPGVLLTTLRGCAYEGSNPDQIKIYGSIKIVFLNFSAWCQYLIQHYE